MEVKTSEARDADGIQKEITFQVRVKSKSTTAHQVDKESSTEISGRNLKTAKVKSEPQKVKKNGTVHKRPSETATPLKPRPRRQTKPPSRLKPEMCLVCLAEETVCLPQDLLKRMEVTLQVKEGALGQVKLCSICLKKLVKIDALMKELQRNYEKNQKEASNKDKETDILHDEASDVEINKATGRKRKAEQDLAEEALKKVKGVLTPEEAKESVADNSLVSGQITSLQKNNVTYLFGMHDSFTCEICNLTLKTDKELKEHKVKGCTTDKGISEGEDEDIGMPETENIEPRVEGAKNSEEIKMESNPHDTLSCQLGEPREVILVEKLNEIPDGDFSDKNVSKDQPSKPKRKKNVKEAKAQVKVENECLENDENETIPQMAVEEFPCPICDAGYVRDSILALHIEQYHWITKELDIVCIVCKETFPTIESILPHARSHRNTMQSCSSCEAVFPTPCQLVDHRAAMHKNKTIKVKDSTTYECNICNESFETASLLSYHRLLEHGCTTHISIMKPKQKFACEYCEKSFHKKLLLVKHMSKHAHTKTKGHESQLTCEKCSETFPDVKGRDEHMLICQGPQKYLTDGTLTEFPCGVCDSIFDTLRGVEAHVSNAHWITKTTGLDCIHCEFTCDSLDKIADHARSHRSSMIPCKRCPDAVFVQAYQLSAHFQAVHTKPANQEQLTICCTVCEEPSETKSLLAHHYLVKHGRFLELHSETQVYQCPHCEKTFVTFSFLRRHLKTHPKNKEPRPPKYQCSTCKEVFQVQILLERHYSEGPCQPEIEETTPDNADSNTNKNLGSGNIPKKSGKKSKQKGPFLCTYCGQQYKCKSSLNQHISGHTGIAKYQCEVCERKFVTKYLYTQHMASHNKPFVCTTCGARFGYADHLRDHEVTHTDRRDWVCKICSKAFRWRLSMLSHLHTVHKIGKKIKSSKNEEIICMLCNIEMRRNSFKRHCSKTHANIPFSYENCQIKTEANSHLGQKRRLTNKRPVIMEHPAQTVIVPELGAQEEEVNVEVAPMEVTPMEEGVVEIIETGTVEESDIPFSVQVVEAEDNGEAIETYIYSDAEIPAGVTQILQVQGEDVQGEPITCLANVASDGTIHIQEWSQEITLT